MDIIWRLNQYLASKGAPSYSESWRQTGTQFKNAHIYCWPLLEWNLIFTNISCRPTLLAFLKSLDVHLAGIPQPHKANLAGIMFE